MLDKMQRISEKSMSINGNSHTNKPYGVLVTPPSGLLSHERNHSLSDHREEVTQAQQHGFCFNSNCRHNVER